MPDPSIGPLEAEDLFRVTFRQTLFNQRVLNMLWYRVTATHPAVERWVAMQELAAAMVAPAFGIRTQLLALQTPELEHQSVRVNIYHGITNRFPYYELLSAAPGTHASASNSVNQAISIEKRSEFPPSHPRQGIGKMQVAGVPVEEISEGVYSPAYLAEFSNLLEDLADTITSTSGIDFVPVLVTFTDTDITPHDVFQCTVKPEVRTMNRRTVGRGE